MIVKSTVTIDRIILMVFGLEIKFFSVSLVLRKTRQRIKVVAGSPRFVTFYIYTQCIMLIRMSNKPFVMEVCDHP